MAKNIKTIYIHIIISCHRIVKYLIFKTFLSMSNFIFYYILFHAYYIYLQYISIKNIDDFFIISIFHKLFLLAYQINIYHYYPFKKKTILLVYNLITNNIFLNFILHKVYINVFNKHN